MLLSILLIGIGYVGWHSPGQTAPIAGPDGRPRQRSIARWQPVPINGSTQWLLIRGQDSTRPVLLFLHGGPGLPELSLLTGSPLESRFVVVHWEQRGAGKSYDPTVFDQTFTVNQFVDDAAKVSRWLTNHFRGPGGRPAKLYVLAHSWGTFLAVLTAQKHPELFRALFCVGQIARQMEAEQISYDWALAEAQRRGDDGRVGWLRAQGRPPYPPGAWLDYLTRQRPIVADYGGGMYRGNFYPLFIRSLLLCPEYKLTDKLHYGLGAQQAVRRLWPAVVETDLLRAAPTLNVPYFLFQGVHDYQTPYPIARRYFDHVAAPQKRLFTFQNSAHSPLFEEPGRFLRCFDQALRELPDSVRSSFQTP